MNKSMDRTDRFWLFLLLIIVAMVALVCLTSCDTLRVAPTEEQKQVAQIGVESAYEIHANGTTAGSELARVNKEAAIIGQKYIGIPDEPAIPSTILFDTARNQAKANVNIQDVAGEVEGILEWLTPFLEPAVLAAFGLGGLGITTYARRAKKVAGELKVTQDQRAMLDIVLREIIAGIEDYKKQPDGEPGRSIGESLSEKMSPTAKAVVHNVKIGA